MTFDRTYQQLTQYLTTELQFPAPLEDTSRGLRSGCTTLISSFPSQQLWFSSSLYQACSRIVYMSAGSSSYSLRVTAWIWRAWHCHASSHWHNSTVSQPIVSPSQFTAVFAKFAAYQSGTDCQEWSDIPKLRTVRRSFACLRHIGAQSVTYWSDMLDQLHCGGSEDHSVRRRCSVGGSRRGRGTMSAVGVACLITTFMLSVFFPASVVARTGPGNLFALRLTTFAPNTSSSDPALHPAAMTVLLAFPGHEAESLG